MLYDNALLLETYALAYGRWQDPEDLEVLNGILAFANRELVAPGGGYFASLDADAEGEEGRYYVWTNEEIESLLADDAVWFKSVFRLVKTVTGKEGISCTGIIPEESLLPRPARRRPWLHCCRHGLKG